MIRATISALLLIAISSVVVADEIKPVVAASEEGAVQPALAADADGKLYLVYGAGSSASRQIWLRTSDDGTTWSEPELVSEGAVEVMVGNTRGPHVAVVEDTIVVTAFANFRKGEDRHLYAFRKRAKDKKFTPVRVSGDRAKDGEGLHQMIADSKGTLHAVWMDNRNGGTEPWYAYSTNEGKAWKGETSVYSAPDGSICPCCAPSVAAKGKTVIVQFRNKLKGKDGAFYNDMYAAYSDDAGRKWDVKALDDRERWKG